jgi:hypothetical protein
MESQSEILAQAMELMPGKFVREDSRGWATFWCPFHPDEQHQGRSKKPNFGVNLENGQWKCLRCWKAGGSINSLRRQLGIVDWRPSQTPVLPRRAARPPSQVSALDEAISVTRAGFIRSPAAEYAHKVRHLSPYVSLVYGLGYGLPRPSVSRETWQAARVSKMLLRDGEWLWAGGVVYADPPTQPSVINVRYIPVEMLSQGDRSFTPPDNHHTWGNRIQPLGAWRITAATKTVLVVEGMFDMLVAAQEIRQRGGEREAVAVYTNGASPARKLLDWFGKHDYEYVVIPDPDKAGEEWVEGVTQAIHQGTGKFQVARPPDGHDPDEAFLSGWWPF